jgi:hypothetical protein
VRCRTRSRCGEIAAHPEDTPLITTLKAADILQAAPGDTEKVVKVFVRNAAGLWSH